MASISLGIGFISILIGIIVNNPPLILIGASILIGSSLWLLRISQYKQEQAFQETLID
jgi:ABC-type uncharacterized transport system permease subunit